MLSEKMKGFHSSVFVRIKETMEKASQKGIRIIDLSVGTPDRPPAEHIKEAFKAASLDNENYKYALVDSSELILAARNWYERRWNVNLSQKNVCGLIGSQDGLAHLPLALLDPGDIVLIPDPGYPMFHTGAMLAHAERVLTPLEENNGFIPNLEEIPPETAHRAKLLIISYPSNPIGRLASMSFFEQCVWFAKKYGLVVLHDNAYGELVFDGKKAHSFLETKGALEVGVEFNSLSKSYNLTGARISFMLGNSDLCEGMRRLKSNLDYGIFTPIQKMAAAALNGPQNCVLENMKAYETRRNVLIKALCKYGWIITPPEASMFVWAKLPQVYNDSVDFVLNLLEETGVALVPGNAFGQRGAGYVRFALVRPLSELEEAADRIGRFLARNI